MPVEQFVRDLPFAVALEQRKNVGCAGVGSGPFAGPMLYLQMHDGDTLDNLNACETRNDVWRRTVFIDPPEDVFNGTRILDSLAVAGNGCRGMKRWAHEITITGACACDIAMHGASDRVMLDELRIGGRYRSGEIAGLVSRKGTGEFGS